MNTLAQFEATIGDRGHLLAQVSDTTGAAAWIVTNPAGVEISPTRCRQFAAWLTAAADLHDATARALGTPAPRPGMWPA